MAAADHHLRRFQVDFEDAEAAAEVRDELLERGAFHDDAECDICGAETVVLDGRLVTVHWRGCLNARAHLRVVS